MAYLIVYVSRTEVVVCWKGMEGRLGRISCGRMEEKPCWRDDSESMEIGEVSRAQSKLGTLSKFGVIKMLSLLWTS